MLKPVWNDILDRVTTNPVDLIAFGTSVLTTGIIPLQPLLSGDVRSAAGLGAITAGAVWFLFRSFRLLRPRTILTTRFTGVRPLLPNQVWPRDLPFDEIVTRIQNGANTMIFVSGRSGAGKTTLLQSRVIPGFTSAGWVVVRVEEYADVAESIWRGLGGETSVALAKVRDSRVQPGAWLPDGKPILFMFDQLERLVGTAGENVDWLRRFCAAVKETRHLRVVGVVRQEFYYQLRVLRELVPAPVNVYEVPDLDFSINDEDVRIVRRLLEEIVEVPVGSSVVSDAIAEPTESGTANHRSLHQHLSPLEIQVAGEALEREYLKNHSIAITLPKYRRLGGTRQSLLRAYFDYYIARSPDRELAPAVLFALSVAPPPHALNTSQVCRATYALPEHVDRLLQYFADVGLIRPVRRGYQWVHESLATMYLNATPTDMLPALPRGGSVSRAARRHGVFVRDSGCTTVARC